MSIDIVLLDDSETAIRSLRRAVADRPRMTFTSVLTLDDLRDAYAARSPRNYFVLVSEKTIGGDDIVAALRGGEFEDVRRIIWSSSPPVPPIAGVTFVDKNGGGAARTVTQEAAANVIDDPDVIDFSDSSVRPGADRMAQAYYSCVAVIDRWFSLGGGQPAIDIMERDIRDAANRIVVEYEREWRMEGVWFVSGLNVAIPNDDTRILDGSPEDGRPQNEGRYVNGVLNRTVEWQNWLLSATGSFTDSARNSKAIYNTVLIVSDDGPSVMTVADAGNFINRCTELQTNYEANSEANLQTLLRLAVNPTP